MPYPRKVMLVDDEQDIIATGSAALQANGYRVDGFTDPALALAEFRKNARQYALVISDIRMPHMSGFQLARSVQDIRPDAPIVFMTAFEIAKAEFSQLFPSSRVVELVTKPVSSAQLVGIARRHVGMAEQH